MSEEMYQSARVRSAFEVRPLLDEIAKKIGELHGVTLGVVYEREGLFFVNGLGDIIQDGPLHQLACTEQEIATGDYLMYFTPRAFKAALCEAFAQDYVRRQMGGVN